MIAIDIGLVGVAIASAIYLFKRAGYQYDRNLAVDDWIFLNGDKLWRYITGIGRFACVGLIGLVGGLIWLDVTKPEGAQVSVDLFLRPSAPVCCIWVGGAVLVIGLVLGAIAAVLHHCSEKHDCLPARRVFFRNSILGLIGGLFSALNIPQIPDGTVGMLFGKALTLRLTDELVANITGSLHIDNPDFYLHVIRTSPVVAAFGIVAAVWMVLSLFTHALWRRANDSNRLLLYPITLLAFGAALYVLFSQVGIFLAGYALQFILYTISLVITIWLLKEIIPRAFRMSAQSSSSCESYSSSPSYDSSEDSPEVTTTYRDEDGHEYRGRGKRPEQVEGGPFFDRGTFDRSFVDGKFHERFGNRVLNPDD